MSSIPSFFLLSSGDREATSPGTVNEAESRREGTDAGGAWTKVTNRKLEKKLHKRVNPVRKKPSTVKRKPNLASTASVGSGNNNPCPSTSGSSGSNNSGSSSSSSSNNSSNNNNNTNNPHPSSGNSNLHIQRSAATATTIKSEERDSLRGGVSWRVPHEPSVGENNLAALTGKKPEKEQRPASFASKAALIPPPLGATRVKASFSQADGATPTALPTVSHEYIDRKDVDGLRSLVDMKEREKQRLKMWNALIRNVNVSIDDMYYMCEFESSEEHCRKAIEMLSTYTTDFRDLCERLDVQSKFSSAPVFLQQSGTQSPTKSRKDGLAWEVRKGSASPAPALYATSAKVSGSSAWVKKPTILTDDKGHSVPAGDEPARAYKRDSPGKARSFSTIFQQERKENETTGEVVLRMMAKPQTCKLDEVAAAAAGASAISTCAPPSSTAAAVGVKVILDDDDDNDERGNSSSPETDSVASRADDAREEDLAEVSRDEGSLFGDEEVCDVTDCEDAEKWEEENGIGHESSVAKPEPRINTFTDDYSCSSSMRWGDEVVGLDDESVAVASPKSKRCCDMCSRFVISRDVSDRICGSCQALVDANPGFYSVREVMMRTLHEKLSSPERRKPSPSETMRRQSEKQEMAKLNREKLELQRQARLRAQSSRQEQLVKSKQESQLERERAISERLERAAMAREAQLKIVAKKAENESLKVNEVHFINELTELERTAQLHKKLEDGEKRRKEFIGTIREKAERQTERAEARRLREQDKEQQLRETMQKRHEDAEKRKAEALEEQRRRLDEMVQEASAKVSERRTEMEKEREAKLILVRERKERAEQERMKHLLAKRAVGRNSATPGSPSGSYRAGGFDAYAAEEELLDQQDNASCPDETPAAPVEDHGHGLPVKLPETAEERLARLAEEEAAIDKEMLARERAMKKKARKSAARIEELCESAALEADNGHSEVPREAKELQAKVIRTIDALARERSLESGREAMESLLKSDGAAIGVIRARPEILNQSLLPSVTRQSFLEQPRRATLTLSIAAHLCEIDSSVALSVLRCKGRASSIVEICVWLLREGTNSHAVAGLVGGLRLLRALIGCPINAKIPANPVMIEASLELARLCIYSSLVLRLAEQCTQIRCGRRWMSCALGGLTESGHHQQQQQQSASHCAHVQPALTLVRASLGLIEGMAFVANQMANSSACRASALEAFLEAAQQSSLFRIVSQMVAACLAVEGLYDAPARPSTACSTGSAASQTNNFAAVKCPQETKELLRGIARSGLRALNMMACIDVPLVQGVLGSPAMPFELQQLLRYVLAACQDGGSEIPAPPPLDWQEMSLTLVSYSTTSVEELFAELVVLMGFHAQTHENNQESLNWGRFPTPLNRLCSTPLSYYTSAVGKSILFPTLLSICFDNVRALGIVSEELNPLLLLSYLKRRSEPSRSEGQNQAKRFPARLWHRATDFLNNQQSK